MKNAPGRWLAALAVLIVALLIALHFVNGKAVKVPQKPQAVSVLPTNHPAIPQIALHPPKPAEQPKPELDAAGEPKISREQIENCLQEHNRSAASLLAAFHVLGDTNYLIEAAKNFPNDSHVIATVLMRDAFPQDRRKWLDAFKIASPENSLANYLSAQNLLQNGQTDAAIAELQVATSKALFDDFSLQSQLDEEELTECGGKSVLVAGKISLSGISSDVIQNLGTLKQIAARLSEIQSQKSAEGDSNAVQNLSQIELGLANRLLSGDSGKLLVNQLVGLAVQTMAVSQLDQNTSYDFLDGKTPAQVLQENKQEKAAFRELNQSFRVIYPTLTDDEMTSYLQRSKIYGEFAAEQWVVQQHPPPQN